MENTTSDRIEGLDTIVTKILDYLEKSKKMHISQSNETIPEIPKQQIVTASEKEFQDNNPLNEIIIERGDESDEPIKESAKLYDGGKQYKVSKSQLFQAKKRSRIK